MARQGNLPGCLHSESGFGLRFYVIYALSVVSVFDQKANRGVYIARRDAGSCRAVATAQIEPRQGLTSDSYNRLSGADGWRNRDPTIRP
jgi:hypothetical protein